MGITSALVLYAVIWFMVLFMVLPLRLVTQGDAGEVVPGTPEGAPQNLQMGKKLRLTTIISTVVWLIVAGVIVSGLIEVQDFDFLNRLPDDFEAHGRGE